MGLIAPLSHHTLPEDVDTRVHQSACGESMRSYGTLALARVGAFLMHRLHFVHARVGLGQAKEVTGWSFQFTAPLMSPGNQRAHHNRYDEEPHHDQRPNARASRRFA